MADEEKNLTPASAESSSPEQQPEVKPTWQQTKENWYDKIPLTLKQLDIIIGICLTLLGLCFLAIILDAMGIYHFFG